MSSCYAGRGWDDYVKATQRVYRGGSSVRIPAMPIANPNLMAIRIPIDADHHRSEATLDCTYHR
jgi:hypothetical protein